MTHEEAKQSLRKGDFECSTLNYVFSRAKGQYSKEISFE